LGTPHRECPRTGHDSWVEAGCLSISPQCGFASLDTGNPVTAATQIRKLELVCELAREIWGET
jgi:5-methyltetrahydropteroyltriglutamate--homocysteine methyltransferase